MIPPAPPSSSCCAGLKMYGMAHSRHGPHRARSASLRAAVPTLSQLLKAEMAGARFAHVCLSHEGGSLPAYKDISGYDFAASEINESDSAPIAQMRVHRRSAEHCPPRREGTGKTHVATALGVQAIETSPPKGPLFSTFELVNALEQEKAKGKAGQIAETLVRLDLLILDELGYLPFSASGGALLFLCCEALRAHQCHHHHHLSFSEWATVFGDAR